MADDVLLAGEHSTYYVEMTDMESEDRAAVRRGLDAIKPYLAAFVTQRLGDSRATDSDIAGLLKIMIIEWETTFRHHLAPVVRSYVHELRDIRNRWAHEAAFSSTEASRALDTMRQLTNAIGGPHDLAVFSLPQRAVGSKLPVERSSSDPFRKQSAASEPALPKGSAPSDFWDASQFDFSDALNGEIWLRSPEVQQQIQPVETIANAGVIGAQQAMLGSARTPLPWVPDLVGKQWRDESGLIVVGSAYAGFIREYSTRLTVMPLVQYLSASSVADFQNLFLRYVVREDPSYYSPIQNLCTGFGNASRIAMVDLCRVSLVRRGIGDERRSDSSQGIVKEGAAIFERYVESAVPAEWLWQRFVGGKTRCIVALGSTAEHGLLRLFARRGMSIAQAARPFSVSPIANGVWANEYADPSKKLSYWLTNETWWTIRGVVNGTRRTWSVLPVYHPSRHGSYDPDYRRTKRVLELMRAAKE